MMKILTVVLTLVILLIAVMIRQQIKYANIRRTIVQDRQPFLYAGDVFHAVTFFKLEDTAGLVESLSPFVRVIRENSKGKLVYAGQAVFTTGTGQLGEADWDAVIIVQYPSRREFEEIAGSDWYKSVLGEYSKTFTHGMNRPVAMNLMIHQALLLIKWMDILKGNWQVEELKPRPGLKEADGEQGEQLKKIVDSLLALRAVNDKALVIFNLQLAGSKEQREKTEQYDSKMLTRMARLAHGPMHIGKAVMLNEDDVKFKTVVIVYYPGVEYFVSLIQSHFFQGIIGKKQLGHNLSVPTVPILSLLEAEKT
ncbi:MAG: hypothetical protein JRJ39_07720 [Deltaproteobacteria bacterium]|nr:hypothetical protein [Deltaproteobacteria bacterium]